ncbi:DUF5368 domain-containing protein [Leucothrix pacifica]|uniref:DUF5368 domain-containing protein n=1 Tax=Leucothrix pacifica TaxID=1247513 RepID=A0A317CE05_9GAMM|nr:DUF5368 domain-containing protein [Leucothrix pacifica]PWQ94362.1 hypothetical protein DKW60_17155 [Leucothrix pacifica]
MNELTLSTLLAVFEEMFGRHLFWGLVIACTIIAFLFIYVIIRDNKIEAKRLVRAELWAPVGAAIGIAFVFFITSSNFADIGGPIDVIVLILIAVAGAVGMTILAYIVQSLSSSQKS